MAPSANDFSAITELMDIKKLYEEDGLASYYPIDAESTALFQDVADGLTVFGCPAKPQPKERAP